ncbi:Hypothetical_protein [Hexamita inflata]|uniref:Hypothetical_protein n=1 Tax=Hexamita inflata TaxID=28002 RepID=A0AA86QQW3_9EUKA|nr:Hypothetical protein HINF_LOCUS45174 [Hexamita inflata]
MEQWNRTYLELYDNNIDVNLWSGQWQTIQLVDCTFTGELEEGQLQIDRLTLYINYIVDLTPIKNIKANYIEVHVESEEENDKISLQFKHAAKIYAEITNLAFDLSEVTGQFKQLYFRDCRILGDPKNYMKTLADTEVTVIESQNPNINLKALFGIKTKQMNITLQFMEIQSINMEHCNPNFVQIYECSLNLNQMNGKWKRLQFFTCNLQTDNNFTINASHIDIIDSDLTNFQNFSANSMRLSYVPLVQIFPQAKMLSINEAQLECQQSNTNIKKLVLNQCTFTKFSISMFPGLVEIEIEGGQYNQLNFQLNQLLKEKNRALKQHKKNARQMEQQLVQHQKKMRRKQHNKYLDLITKYINNIAISKE